MRVTINGREHLLAQGATLSDAVRAAGADPLEPGVAAAVGERIVARQEWESTPLAEGARVEVVRAAAGG